MFEKFPNKTLLQRAIESMALEWKSLESEENIPFDSDELKIPVQNGSELFQAELSNLYSWSEWWYDYSWDILTEQFLLELHRKCYGDVWGWAGKYRKSITNIGVDPAQIAVSLKNTLNDVKYWTENKTYPIREIGTRLHYRLVSIHPFKDWNGRLARLFSDIFLSRHQESLLNWDPKSKDRYINALKKADEWDYSELLKTL